MFFIQKGTPWNTIQFFYYSLVFSGIFAGVNFAQIVRNKSKILVCSFSLLLILITIPTSVTTLSSVYLPNRPPAKLSNFEIQALRYLKTQPNGVVLTYPFDKNKANDAISNPPRPLYLYESTAYVSAFSGHEVYMEDEVNLEILGYLWQARKLEMEKFYKNTDFAESKDFLIKNNIKYIYLIKGQTLNFDYTKLNLIKIYENEEVLLYRFERM